MLVAYFKKCVKREEILHEKIQKNYLMALGIVASLGLIAYMSVTNHPQLVVGVIQSFMYKESSPNSYSPLYEPIDGLKDNGQYLKSEIAYSKDYPNSFLDITYPDQNFEADRPTSSISTVVDSLEGVKIWGTLWLLAKQPISLTTSCQKDIMLSMLTMLLYQTTISQRL